MNTTIARNHLRILGSALAAGLALLFSEASPTLAQPAPAVVVGPALSVDAAAGNYPIYPEIYGMNFAASSQLTGLHLPVNRWGGNAVTRYNYQTDISNHAMDWYFENIREGNGANPQNDSAANQFINTNSAAGTKTLLTVPTIGVVSNNDSSACGFSIAKYGSQAGNDWEWRPDCGNGVFPGGGYVTTDSDDYLDTSYLAPPAFIQGWVTYLRTNPDYVDEAPEYYALDNEPDLWFDTHRDVHPEGAGYDELFTRGRDYALAIKTAYPNAKVFGPVSWGWWGYFHSAQDVANYDDWWAEDGQHPDKDAHGGADFIPWYLAQMAAYETANPGTRLLDYLDLHFYTQALYHTSDATPVTPGGAGNNKTKAARLNSTRSLWDPTYLESDDESWIDQPVMLIPRMRGWVNANYPGTKLAITEYNWGGLEDINGALAQADVLGIFGREKVDLATLWGPPDPGQPGEYAFRVYLNYNGSGGRFGDTSIQSSSADQSRLSIYGSKDSGSGALKLMVINKTNDALTSSVSLSNFSPSTCMNTYTYSPSNLGAIVPGWQTIGGSSVSYAFPGQSITLLVIPPDGAPCSIPVSALAAPVPTSPKVGAASYKTTTKLAWKKVKGALTYNVQVKDGTSNTIFSVVTKKTSAPAPLGFGRYSWQVQAAAGDGLTAFSPARTFDVTLLKSPKQGATVRASKIVFKWKKVTGATYRLQIWKDGVELPSVDGLTKPSYKPVTPLGPGSYSWTVTVNGQTMPMWTFTAIP